MRIGITGQAGFIGTHLSCLYCYARVRFDATAFSHRAGRRSCRRRPAWRQSRGCTCSYGPLMIIAPAEGSFGSAARACAASSGVRDSASAGFAGDRADSVSLGADAPGVIGASLSSDGEISLKGCDDCRLIVVTVSVAHAESAKPATTKHITNDRMMRTLLS